MLGSLRAALPGPALARSVPSLVSLWTFDGDPGERTIFYDSGPADVAMDVIGAWTSTASIVQGVGGRSGSKTGAAHGIVPANEPAHDLNALTLSVYYQPRTAHFKHVILNRGDGDTPGDFSIERLANGRLAGWHVGQDAMLRYFDSSDGIAGTNLSNGTAHRIDLTLGPRGAHVYLDGRRLSAATLLGHVNGWNNAEPLYVGVWNDGSADPVDGTIDHLRLWDEQMTDGEIAILEAARHVYASIQASEAQSYATKVAITDPAVNFQLYELRGANSVIDRIAGKPGVLVNPGDIEFELPTLVLGGARSMAFGGDEQLPGHITVQDFLVGVGELSVAAVVQPDIVKPKLIILTSREGAGGDRTGDLSVELVDDGAGGLKVRAYSVDGTVTAIVIEGRAGDVAPGQAVHLVYVRQSGVSPSQILYVDGEVRAQDATVRTWPTVPSTNWHLGAWPVGPVAPLDGVIAEVVGWNRALSQAEIQSLALAQGFSHRG